MEKNEVTTQQVWFAIFIVVIFIAGYFIASKFISKSETVARQDIVKEVIKEVIIKKPDCPNTFVLPNGITDNLGVESL